MLQQMRSTALAAMVALGILTGCSSDAPLVQQPAPGEPAAATAVEPQVVAVAPLTDDTPMVHWSTEGVVVRDVDGTLRTVTDEAATAAVLFEAGIVAFQTSADRINIIGEGIDRQVRADQGRTLKLLDGREIGEHRQLLMTSRVTQPVGPDDADEQLLLLDIDTGSHYDLGRIGGWESSVVTGRFTASAIAVLRSQAAALELVLFDHNGTRRSEQVVGSDTILDFAALPGGDELAVFQGGTLRLINAWTGEVTDGLAGEWPCLRQVYAASNFFYCAQADMPTRVELGGTTSEPVEWAATGMVAPAVQQFVGEYQLTFRAIEHIGLRQVAVSPDGAFRYFVDERQWTPQPILVDDGTGLRPATNDPRNLYRFVEMAFVDDRTVMWTSVATGSMTTRFIGRLDEAGTIVDMTGPFFPPSDVSGYDVAAVMTSGRDLDIDVDAPLLDLIEEPDQPFEGAWYSGSTLAADGACGGRTLYRTTADGYGRVLPFSVELDEPVLLAATPMYSGANTDSASTQRQIAVATQCPSAYEGVRVYVLSEHVGYGDGGPRSLPFAALIHAGPVSLPDGTTEFDELSGIAVIGTGCFLEPVLLVGVRTLDGEQLLIDLDGSVEAGVLPPNSPDEYICEDDSES